MRRTLLEQIKSEIEKGLKHFLREEGIELYIAANDNTENASLPMVVLERIEDSSLSGSELLSEIKIILGVFGKPWQCDALVNGLYEALHPHHITHRELTVLLMSLHVETLHCVRPRCLKKQAIVKYIVEEISSANENSPIMLDRAADAECC